MRFYETFPIAINEIRRELKEMGIVVKTKSVQNMDVSDNEDYNAFELQNYAYTVTRPDYTSIPLKCPQWAEDEFRERTCGQPLNPGNAWRLRGEYWQQFLNKFGRFDYAYPERITVNLDRVINALKKDPYTRRAYLPILWASDGADDFHKRFPCSVGYHFLYRQGSLSVTYYLRSSDFGEHFNYDIYLAERLKQFVAEKAGLKPGYFCHFIGSSHIFQHEVKGVF